MAIKDSVNVTALAAGATSLLVTVGGLTATGTIGRLQRNEPEALGAALIIVTLGAVMLVIAGLPITSDRSEIFATLVGSGLSVIGIGWALAAAIGIAGQSERPQIEAEVSEDGKLVEGKVKAANLDSERRMAVLVEGLIANADATEQDPKWDVYTVAQFYVGPDGEGKVELPVKVRMPQRDFEAVGIKAWSDEQDTCPRYPRREADERFTTQINAIESGCVVLPLPPAEAEPPAPQRPRVTLAWVGRPRRSTRARLTVRTPVSGKTVVVLAGSREAGRTRQLVRTVNTVSAAGGYRSSANVRVSRRSTRVCALAFFDDGEARVPQRLRSCPLVPRMKAGRGAAELRRPRGN